MKTKLLRKIRKRFRIQERNGEYRYRTYENYRFDYGRFVGEERSFSSYWTNWTSVESVLKERSSEIERYCEKFRKPKNNVI